MLLADAVLVRLPVSARAGADPGLEAAAAQNLSTGRGGRGHGDSVRHKVSEQQRLLERTERRLLLSGLQGDDYEDRAAIHSAHAARVAHEIIQDCCEFCPDLKRGNKDGERLDFLNFF